jgi:hypothetical protein
MVRAAKITAATNLASIGDGSPRSQLNGLIEPAVSSIEIIGPMVTKHKKRLFSLTILARSLCPPGVGIRE